MPKKQRLFCCSGVCEETTHLMRFPTDQALQEKWTRWVLTNRKDFHLTGESRLCYRHFNISDIENYEAYRLGFNSRMYLRTDVDVLPKIVKPEDAPTPRKLSVRTLPKRERKRVVRGLLAEAATPPAKKPRREGGAHEQDEEVAGPSGVTVAAAIGEEVVTDREEEVVTVCEEEVATVREEEVASEMVTDMAMEGVVGAGNEAESSMSDSGLSELWNLRSKKIQVYTEVTIKKRSSVTQTDQAETGLKNMRELITAEKKLASQLKQIAPGTEKTVLKDVVIIPAVEGEVPALPRQSPQPLQSEESSSTSAEDSSSPPMMDDDDYEPGSEEERDFLEDMSENEVVFEPNSWYSEKKYIVCHSKLMEILRPCPRCCSDCNIEPMRPDGCHVRFFMTCSADDCRHSYTWTNAPIENSIPMLNLLIAAVILFSGSLPTKVLRAFNFLNIAVISPFTYFRYQRDYLHGVVRQVYNTHMDEVHASLAEPISVNADGRFDSPGHSALYGIYSFMDAATSKIVASCLIKSTETTSAAAMELEGLKRCRTYTDTHGVRVDTITTDRHTSVKAYIKNHWKGVTQKFDTWHLAKGIRKKLNKLSSRKVAFKPVGRWIPALVAHLWHVIQNSLPGPMRVDWWKSCTNHIVGIHEHDFDDFQKCKHGPPVVKYNEKGEELEVDYIIPDSELDTETRKILLDKGLVGAIDMASPDSTSELESFHASLNRNAPKMIGFSYSGMLSRLQITILHHNENCQRPVKLTKEGKLRQLVRRSKATKLTPTLQYSRQDPTYNYIEQLFSVLAGFVSAGVMPPLDDEVPQTLASTGPEYESKEALAASEAAKRRGDIRKPHHVTASERMTKSRGRGRPRGRGSRGGTSTDSGTRETRHTRTDKTDKTVSRGRGRGGAAASRGRVAKSETKPKVADKSTSKVEVTKKNKGKAPAKGKIPPKKSST